MKNKIFIAGAFIGAILFGILAVVAYRKIVMPSPSIQTSDALAADGTTTPGTGEGESTEAPSSESDLAGGGGGGGMGGGSLPPLSSSTKGSTEVKTNTSATKMPAGAGVLKVSVTSISASGMPLTTVQNTSKTTNTISAKSNSVAKAKTILKQ